MGRDDEYEEALSGDSDLDEEILSDDADYRGKVPKKPAAKTRGGGGGPSVSAGSKGKRSGPGPSPKKGASKAKVLANTKDKGYAWEATYKRSWDAVREDEGGSLAGAVRGLLEASKRRR
jgi:transcription initiation factor TFIIH subunit 2